jgi:hypothetical protein
MFTYGFIGTVFFEMPKHRMNDYLVKNRTHCGCLNIDCAKYKNSSRLRGTYLSITK